MDLQKSDEKFLIHSDIGTVEDRSQDITSFKDASTFPNPKEGQTFPKVCWNQHDPIQIDIMADTFERDL